MEKWFIKNKNADLETISKTFNISKFISKLLVNRDINTPRLIDSYLNSNIEKLHSPDLFKDMDKAIDILMKYKDTGKKIRIVGDYDVDGVMSTYILKKAFDEIGIVSDYIIPHRVDDGYGINKEIIQEAYNDGVRGIITCDNGIAAIEETKLARSLGMDIIVTDHHDLPFTEIDGKRETIYVDADAIINPKRDDCKYPFEKLCGAAIAYKLVEKLFGVNGNSDSAYKFIEYAAIATVCDVVDLVDENRIIVKEGLKLINNTKNIGLKALINESGLEDKEISIYHIGFVIGPSINASGRLDSALKAIEMLLTDDENMGKNLARELRTLNDERKEMTQNGADNAINKVKTTELKDDTVLVIYEPDAHESVAGIIAGRVKDTFNKPTIVLTNAKEGVKGSARSIEVYNIFEELTMRKDLLNRFGGHPMAAGLSLDYDKIDILRKSLNENSLTKDDLVPSVYIDMFLPLNDISYGLIKEMDVLEPFGKGNSKPVFGDKNVKVEFAQILGKNKNVLKLKLLMEDDNTIEGLIFRNIEDFQEMVVNEYGSEVLSDLYNGFETDINIDLLYYPSINEYMGRTTLQIIIESYRISK